ncbi:hypothetical protein [Vibrio gallaecicus]|nr:hypothetical protein [Vibrio gallaecicus]MDN3614968.1 hypothetical protein [Vibrio gallaecicus]
MSESLFSDGLHLWSQSLVNSRRVTGGRYESKCRAIAGVRTEKCDT